MPAAAALADVVPLVSPPCRLVLLLGGLALVLRRLRHVGGLGVHTLRLLCI